MKRKFYFWAREHINSDSIKMLVLAVPLSFLLIQQVLDGQFDWTAFFDSGILITFMLIAICDWIAKFVQRKVSENTEDSAKVTNDYEKLVRKYSVSDLVTGENSDHDRVVYPVECLWMRKGSEKIVFEDRPEKFYELPKQVADNSKEIMDAHSASAVYNQINIRLDDIRSDPDKNRVVLYTSRTQYFDSLLTNRACDYVFSDRKTTVRELYEPGPFIKPLSVSKMSNHLGFNGFVLTSDKKTIPFILRKKNLSIAKNLWSTSISASLKTSYAVNRENNLTLAQNPLGAAIIGEINDELLHFPSKATISDKKDIREDGALNAEKAQNGIFCFYRDLTECGKPQFLFYLQLESITESELREFISKENVKDDTKADGNIVRFFSLDQLKKAKLGINKIEIEGVEYKMMPASIASIALFLKYLKDESESTQR